MTPSETSFAYFASCVPGLERVLVDELRELGHSATVVVGGVEGRGTLSALYNILRRSRTAESLRVRLRAFRATDFARLERELARLPWHVYLAPGAQPEISVTCHKSRLYHSDAVAQRVQAAIARALGTRVVPVSVDSTSVSGVPRVFVRLDHDVVQVSVDASGERLHRRGYRTHVVEASMRETLAAAVVRLGIGRGIGASVWDPFCGAGTLPLEWLALRGGAASQRADYVIDSWPICKSRLRAGQEAEPEAGDTTLSEACAWLSDIDARAVAAARHNAQALGVAAACKFVTGDFESVAQQVPRDTAILANPPYGVRLDTQRRAAQLMERFERVLLARVDLRPALIVCPEHLLHGKRRLAWQTLARFPNGGIPVSLFAV